MHPAVSIIIPVYQTEAYLERCVRSLLVQTFPDFELILVDDGSTDGSAALCDTLAARDARIRVIHQENGGVSRARNRGLAEAAGERAVFVDSDDWVDENFLEALLACREQAGSTLGVCGFAQHLGGETVYPAAGRPQKTLSARDFLLETLREENGLTLTACGWLIPSELARKTGFEEGRTFGEDSLFLCRVLQQAESVAFTPDTCYHYDMERDGNTYTRRSVSRSRQILEAWEKTAKILGTEDAEIRAETDRILTDIALQTARQAAQEGDSKTKQEMRGKAAGF